MEWKVSRIGKSAGPENLQTGRAAKGQITVYNYLENRQRISLSQIVKPSCYICHKGGCGRHGSWRPGEIGRAAS
jgi:hypothetical protein